MTMKGKYLMSKTRLEILLPKGQEEILPEEAYEMSGSGMWLEDQGTRVLVRSYPSDADEFLRLLKNAGIIPEEIRTIEENEQDYAALTKKYFRPIRIEDVSIVAPWNKTRKDGRSRIIIEPGMAFGTGRHESTRLMMKLMRSIDLSGKGVLDLGCGSAILSLYASLRGAREVLAVDHEVDAVLSARKNLDLNNSKTIQLVCSDISSVCGTYDVVLANLDIRTFTALSGQVAAFLSPQARLIVSGILGHDRKKLLSLFSGLTLLQMEERNAWRGFLFLKES